MYIVSYDIVLRGVVSTLMEHLAAPHALLRLDHVPCLIIPIVHSHAVILYVIHVYFGTFILKNNYV